MADALEPVIKRIMPHSTEAEQSVIGGIGIDPQSISMVSEIIPDAEMFYNRSYGAIYEAMLELHKEGTGIDPVTLQNKLKEKDVPPEVSDLKFLRELIISSPTSAHVKYYANIVAEKATLRELIKVTEKISADCYQGKDNLTDLLEETEKKVFKIVQRRNVGELTPIDQVVMESLEMIEKAAKTTGDVTGLATGFIDLDHKTAGLQPGNLVLIAARPAMGKTSFVLSLARNVIINLKKPIAMFSLEMSKAELVNRLLSMDSKVDSQKFKTGQLTEGDWESLIESGGNIGNAPLYLDDMSTTIGEIRSKCRKLKLEKDIQLVIIDYLQLMNGSGKTDSRQQEISEISRALKLMAKELKVPVIALSQLSRQVEGRPDHRPMLSDLRESGAIEQDADVVLFIYRDEVYHPDTDKKCIAEIIIAKQRSGPIGTVELAWLPEYTQFGNLAK
ncbi:MAG: replicative DNA helicase [Lachnospiraceae bacterium]|nr:replicative DNA helicase [Lachnospiraceae bacterium]MBQ8260970.1 replicative DNA helicase [Lachnospiraceae bacterium]